MSSDKVTALSHSGCEYSWRWLSSVRIYFVMTVDAHPFPSFTLHFCYLLMLLSALLLPCSQSREALVSSPTPTVLHSST